MLLRVQDQIVAAAKHPQGIGRTRGQLRELRDRTCSSGSCERGAACLGTARNGSSVTIRVTRFRTAGLSGPGSPVRSPFGLAEVLTTPLSQVLARDFEDRIRARSAPERAIGMPAGVNWVRLKRSSAGTSS